MKRNRKRRRQDTSKREFVNLLDERYRRIGHQMLAQSGVVFDGKKFVKMQTNA